MRLLATIASAVSLLASHSAPSVLPGGALLGTMRIPAIGLVTPVFEGPHPASDPQLMYEAGKVFLPELDHGPAHYPGNAEPWQQGTVVFSGHRVTHSRPFNRLGNIRLGDFITLATSWGTYHYRVVSPPSGHAYARNGYAIRGSSCALHRACGIVSQYAGWFFRWKQSGHWLVLLACAPPGNLVYRLAVFAKRV